MTSMFSATRSRLAGAIRHSCYHGKQFEKSRAHLVTQNRVARVGVLLDFGNEIIPAGALSESVFSCSGSTGAKPCNRIRARNPQ
jgi:hypothetical protein